MFFFNKILIELLKYLNDNNNNNGIPLRYKPAIFK